MSTAQSLLLKTMDAFRPPVNHYMKNLDRSFFQKRVPLSAAKIFDKKQISQCREELAQDTLVWNNYPSIVDAPENGIQNTKVLLMRPDILVEDRSTWSQKLQRLVDVEKVAVIPYTLELSYKNYSYNDIMEAIIPKDGLEELPTGFALCGHIAHLNLRDQWLPYKRLIANVLMDKNHHIRTVINKIEAVGERSKYRTFTYELLAGLDDMKVEHVEEGFVFRFDYSKVYWNSRLNNEHRNLVKQFQPGEAVCDVMAGVGPFAVPSGAKHVFVWANDLNPDCYSSLKDSIERNKVDKFVRAFNEDGHLFIRRATQNLLHTNTRVTIHPKLPKISRTATRAPFPPPSSNHVKKVFFEPKTFNHYVMNLPESAISFLPNFVSLYTGYESLFAPQTDTKLPFIHVYCFLPYAPKETNHATEDAEKLKICEIISENIGYKLLVEDPEVEISFVRAVSPAKAMYRVTFRLPADVAFRKNA